MTATMEEPIVVSRNVELKNKGMFFDLVILTRAFILTSPVCFQFSRSSNNPRDDIATEAYEDELDMGRSGSYLNSSINSAWSEHSLDPDDIRVHANLVNFLSVGVFCGCFFKSQVGNLQ